VVHSTTYGLDRRKNHSFQCYPQGTDADLEFATILDQSAGIKPDHVISAEIEVILLSAAGLSESPT